MKNLISSLSRIGFLLTISCLACKKKSDQNNPTTVVYVAGSIPGTNGPIPAFWKNSVATSLSSPNPYGAVTAMTIVGSDIYFAGYSFTNSANPANSAVTYWKNGVASVLQNYDFPGSATGIAVSGTDIYITGYSNSLTDDSVPAYWKNGVVDTLQYSGQNVQTLGIAVAGTNVYVVGHDDWLLRSLVWKNGVMTSLGLGYPAAIAIADTNVYVAGDSYPSNGAGVFIATIWENALTTPLSYTNPTYYASQANAIAISGSDVYVAGYTVDQNGTGTDVATYWKNGLPVTLDHGMANAIYVSGSDVYVAGNKYNNTGLLVPVYWKNGVAQSLQGNGSANAISVIAP
jgi:hypothetical protein